MTVFIPEPKKRHKFGAKKTELDGITFDSKAEAARWAELKLLERGKAISRLERQPELCAFINGHVVFQYRGDFQYYELPTNLHIVEDVKGIATETFRLKWKIMKILYPGIHFRIVSTNKKLTKPRKNGLMSSHGTLQTRTRSTATKRTGRV